MFDNRACPYARYRLINESFLKILMASLTLILHDLIVSIALPVLSGQEGSKSSTMHQSVFYAVLVTSLTIEKDNVCERVKMLVNSAN